VSAEIYRKARVRAAELDTSVSAVVAEALEHFASGDRAESRRRRLGELRERTPAFSAGGRLPREELYGSRSRRR
jgi:hypothetical protein